MYLHHQDFAMAVYIQYTIYKKIHVFIIIFETRSFRIFSGFISFLIVLEIRLTYWRIHIIFVFINIVFCEADLTITNIQYNMR